MNINELFPSKYIKGEDIKGKEVTFTIKSVALVQMWNGQENKATPVIWFSDESKGMILKESNGKVISKLYGPDTDRWRGKRITLYTEQMRAFGEMQTVLKVKPKVPTGTQPVEAAPPKHESKARVAWEDMTPLQRARDAGNKGGQSPELAELIVRLRMADQDDADTMPVEPAPGKSMSMFDYLLMLTEDALEGEQGEIVLSFLYGRCVTHDTPPTLSTRFLIDELRAGQHKSIFVEAYRLATV